MQRLLPRCLGGQPKLIALPPITFARYLLPALAGFALAWSIQGWRLDAAENRHAANMANLEKQQANAQVKAEANARARIEMATARAEAAVRAQARLETRLKEEQARAKAALYALPSRPCLGGDHLGLLSQSPGIRLEPVPQAAGSTARPAARPAAAASADTSGQTATDTDVTGWMMDAAALYETCRSRIDALRQWADHQD